MDPRQFDAIYSGKIMNTRTRTILMAAAFAAAASALGSQAADNDASSQAKSQDTQSQATPSTYGPEAREALRDTADGESAHTAAENAWLIQERIQDSNGSKPLVFVQPASNSSADSTGAR